MILLRCYNFVNMLIRAYVFCIVFMILWFCYDSNNNLLIYVDFVKALYDTEEMYLNRVSENKGVYSLKKLL